MDLNEEKDISEIVPKPIEQKKSNIKPILKQKSKFNKSINVETEKNENKDIMEKSIKLFEKMVIKEAEKVNQGNEQRLVETTTEFMSTWKHIKNNTEACEKFLVGLVKPQRIPQIFKEGIEIDLFLEMVNFLKNDVDKNLELCANIMSVLPKIKRFEIVTKSLISKEKKDLRGLLDKCSNASTRFLSPEQVESLNKFSSLV